MTPIVTLITGCSSGIGMTTALRLASETSRPFIVYATMRNLAKSGDLEKAAGAALNSSIFVRELDVTKPETIAATVSHIVAKHGHLDVLINNAGLAGQTVLELTSMETIRTMFDANFFGTVQVIQEVIPIMKKQRSGRIINVSSTMGLAGLPFYEMYASTKFAVEGLSECMAMQLREFNIWVSTVQPGPVKTKILENMAANALPTDQQDDPRLDPITKELFMKCLANRKSKFDSAAQPVEEVAETIYEVVTAAKPSLRNPTNKFAKFASTVKYADVTGDTWVDRYYEQNASTSASPSDKPSE